uniref:Phosphodiesterase n=1 Tax=Ephydatia fluviatilis TaxID=31330 RepID=O96078_9METZ|nr:EFPDE4 [Ephydatia fluviatilis]
MAAGALAGTSRDPATQWQGEIDRYTGLPRLDIELLPGMESFARNPPSSDFSPQAMRHPSGSIDEKSLSSWKKKMACMKKNRSRSVAIRLQVPTRLIAPHHSINTAGETTDDSVDSVTTFPTEEVFRFPSDVRRRSDHCLDKVASDLEPFRRRSSFLHQSDAEEPSSKSLSRVSSCGSHVGDETFSTPFAQILANFRCVRANLSTLLDEEKLTTVSEDTTVDERSAQLAKDTMMEFDWCMQKLETVDRVKMGSLAQDKFQRVMSRELTQLSERSLSGHRVAEWVQDITRSDRDDEIDRAIERSSIAEQDPEAQSPTTVVQPTAMLEGAASSVSQDLLHEVVKNKINSEDVTEFFKQEAWDMDIFLLDTVSGNSPLVAAAYHVFKARDLFSEMKIVPSVFLNFISTIESKYHSNPYHNALHAADVLLATNHLLKAKALEPIFTQLEVFAALVAAIIHDVDHPGRNNQFLVSTEDPLAILYNDESVLENHHLALAFELMKDPTCNFLESTCKSQKQAFRKLIIDMVLATDMSRHFKYLGQLKTLLESNKVANNGLLQLDKYHDRVEVLQGLLHCADLSNQTKSFHIASQWSQRIMEESYRQGDEERKLGIPVNPLGDRSVSIEKCQVTFIDYIVYPLWETWAELVYPDAQDIVCSLMDTRDQWQCRMVHSPPLSSELSEFPSNTAATVTDSTCVRRPYHTT